jgi:hypothetical protein
MPLLYLNLHIFRYTTEFIQHSLGVSPRVKHCYIPVAVTTVLAIVDCFRYWFVQPTYSVFGEHIKFVLLKIMFICSLFCTNNNIFVNLSGTCFLFPVQRAGKFTSPSNLQKDIDVDEPFRHQICIF